jgi:hypothetical protein
VFNFRRQFSQLSTWFESRVLDIIFQPPIDGCSTGPDITTTNEAGPLMIIIVVGRDIFSSPAFSVVELGLCTWKYGQPV